MIASKTIVHVRKGAGTGDGCGIIISVNSGELLMIIGKTQPGGQTIPWYEIELNGQELYIRSDFVDIVPETKLDEEGIVASTTTTYAHVRYLPGTSDECRVTDSLNNGTTVEVLGKLQPSKQSLPWYRVKYSRKIGFIRSDLISISGSSGESDYPLGVIKDGWFKGISGSWYYFEDAKPLTGLQIVEDFFTIFDANGVLIVDAINYKLDGNTFYIRNGIARCMNNLNINLLLYSFTDYNLKNTEKFDQGAINHIFKGDINEPGVGAKSVKITGCHVNLEEFQPYGNPESTTNYITYKEGLETKAYEAPVVGEYRGIPLKKATEQGWFPEDWNAQKIIDSIVEILDNGAEKIENNPRTVKIVGYIDNICIMVYKSKETGLITSAFPITKKVFEKYFTDIKIPDLETPNSEDDIDKPLNNDGEDGEDDKDGEDVEGEVI